MALNRIACPECAAGLKSPTGFTIGQTVCCPKCETYFVVEEPADEEEEEKPKKAKPTAAKAGATTGKKPVKAALPDDDDDDDRPRKKKKKKRDDDDDDDPERSYKNSPLRYAVLGILVVTMLVLGYFLYDKRQKEKNDSASTDSGNSTPSGPPPGAPIGAAFGPGGPKGPGMGPGGPKGPGGMPIVPGVPKGPGGIPKGPGSVPKGPGGVPFQPNGLTAAQKDVLLRKYKADLIGSWKADLGDGVTVELKYEADGKVTQTTTTSAGPRTFTGQWQATDVWGSTGGVGGTGLGGRTGLTVTWGKDKPMQLVFEDDELQHPVQGQGVIGIFRKA